MIDPQRLRLLVDFDRLGTLTLVGQSRHLSTSGVSQQLAVLEREAGTPLLQRQGRRVRLTDEGALLVRHGQKILAAVEAAEADLAASRTTVAGKVRIGGFASCAAALLPAVCGALARDYPALTVTVDESETHQSLRRVALGDLDVVVVDSFAERPYIDDEALVSEHLTKDPLLVILPSSHPLARESMVRMDQLAGEPWLMEESGTYLSAYIEQACAAAGFRPSVAARFRNAGVALAFAAAGLGVAVLPEMAVAAAPPDTVRIPLSPAAQRRIIVVVRRSNQRKPSVQAVVTALKATLLAQR